MISSRLQSEVDLHDSTMSETLSDTSSSSYQNYKIHHNNRTRKFNKLRSIKLVKLPSVRLRSPQPKIESDGEHSSQSNPNYMKTTTSSTAKDNLKKPTRSLTRRSSFRPQKSFSRLPSGKFRRSLMKKSKSVKLRINRSAEAADFSDSENAQFQASTNSSKSSSKMLKKMSSLRTNRLSMKKTSHLLEKNIHRATCSSTLKDSKFPNHLEIQSESQGVSALKVCPYTYCSLHGHRHATLPPLKRFVSMRRRVLKTQRSRKLERQPSLRTKRSSNAKKVVQGRERPSYKDAAALEKEDGSTKSDSSIVASEIRGEMITWEEKSTILDQIDQDSASGEEKGKEYFSKKGPESANAANERRIEKKKNMGLWNLIYKHMATGIVSEDEVQTAAPETFKEDAENIDTCCSSSADNDRKQNAVKLVKEAFDKILSEIPDQPHDDQSKYVSKNNHEAEESGISTSFKSEKDGVEQEAEAKKTPSNWSNLKKLIVLKRFVKALDKVRTFNPRKPRFLPLPTDPEAEKVHLRHQSTEEKKKSEEWMLDYALQQVISTLGPAQKRKVALLVQAFESVSPVPSNGTIMSPSCKEVEIMNFGISPREMRSDVLANTSNDVLANCKMSGLEVSDVDSGFSGQHDVENAEDYVVGNVRVSALEVIALDSEPNRKFSDQYDVVNTSNDVLTKGEVSAPEVGEFDSGFSDQHAVESTATDVLVKGNVSASDVLANTSNDVLANCKMSGLEVSDVDSGFSGQHDVENAEDYVVGNVRVSALEVIALDSGFSDQYDVVNTSNDVLTKGEVSAPEVGEFDSGFSDQHDVESTSTDVLVKGNVSASEVRDIESGFTDQNNVAKTSNGEISTSEVHDLDFGFNKQLLPSKHQTHGGDEQSNSPKNCILQRLQHLNTNGDVNSSAPVPELAEISGESNVNSTDLTNEKQKNMGLWYLIYKHMVSGTTTPLLDEPAKEMNNTDLDPHIASSRKVDSQQIKAIQMVEEAIDEIPLPDSQDDMIPDQNLLETKPAIYSATLDPKEQCMNKTKQDSKKSWSNLKKMILLKRFVKALEKVKDFNLREPRFLPVEGEKEAEKVLLRHQDMEDRKNADEWMLDYTLQQVVAKLTPARKRKVQLLVEAFETVIPTIES